MVASTLREKYATPRERAATKVFLPQLFRAWVLGEHIIRDNGGKSRGREQNQEFFRNLFSDFAPRATDERISIKKGDEPQENHRKEEGGHFLAPAHRSAKYPTKLESRMAKNTPSP